ncbi:DUF4041 domain-containing protein [Allokutzneria albata]|uniref:DUF4041 domain-containing protein n=1 Tax=Allokutzneria albata TaxID=211114 RepID=UPI00138E2332|nr:DUF4041 domain-containing protein [Allokutzneria albata]
MEAANAALEQRATTLTEQLRRVGALEYVQLQGEIHRMRGELGQLRELHAVQVRDHEATLAAQRAEHGAELARTSARRAHELVGYEKQIEEAKRTLVPYTEEMLYQDAGLFTYHHPLADADAYKHELVAVTDRIKSMIRDKRAVHADGNFTFNNSAAQGRKMVNDWCKLMLRAYNAEAENCLRTMRAGSLHVAKTRLNRTAEAIGKLGRLLGIRISQQYQALRLQELELTADYLRKKQEEKEAERERRAQLREEAKAQAELRREIEKLEKERRHLENVQKALREKGNEEAARALQAELDAVTSGIEGLHAREANVRAGYVYVISNVGAFGPRMVKIGMTRRLVPDERVQELGDASVPFRYDTHIMFFSRDAVGLEAALHRELSDRRVNQVNLRREFFYATPEEVRDLLRKHAGEVLEYVVEPEAAEFRMSRSLPAAS